MDAFSAALSRHSATMAQPLKQIAGIIKSNTLLKRDNRYKRIEAPNVFGKRLHLRLAELRQRIPLPIEI